MPKMCSKTCMCLASDLVLPLRCPLGRREAAENYSAEGLLPCEMLTLSSRKSGPCSPSGHVSNPVSTSELGMQACQSSRPVQLFTQSPHASYLTAMLRIFAALPRLTPGHRLEAPAVLQTLIMSVAMASPPTINLIGPLRHVTYASHDQQFMRFRVVLPHYDCPPPRASAD